MPQSQIIPQAQIAPQPQAMPQGRTGPAARRRQPNPASGQGQSNPSRVLGQDLQALRDQLTFLEQRALSGTAGSPLSPSFAPNFSPYYSPYASPYMGGYPYSGGYSGYGQSGTNGQGQSGGSGYGMSGGQAQAQYGQQGQGSYGSQGQGAGGARIVSTATGRRASAIDGAGPFPVPFFRMDHVVLKLDISREQFDRLTTVTVHLQNRFKPELEKADSLSEPERQSKREEVLREYGEEWFKAAQEVLSEKQLAMYRELGLQSQLP